MAGYLDAQIDDVSHREVLGPVLHGSATGGTVAGGGATVGSGGDTSVWAQPVADTVELEVLDTGAAGTMT